MGDQNKKRAGSFRKLFPNLFFSHKSKEKNGNKDSKNNVKGVTDSSQGNQYHNPRMIRPDNNSQGSIDNERIYENLATQRSDNETQSYDISHHSSSSTLVSDSVRNKSYNNEVTSGTESITYTKYTARPQVPRKPINEMQHSQTSNQMNQLRNDNSQYPDVYYHSLEKLTDKISPLDEIEIYRASQAQANPASVGAEIKRVSTKFLISPKKEAEIRTIQPTRARSLSFDTNKENDGHRKDNTKQSVKSQSVKKSYNYSAPTTPIPVSLKIPNMPKTVSPYEHVRKAIMESEKRRNSLSKTSHRNKSTPSPRLENARSTPTPTMQDSIDKQKTRQKVEAFYWQKLKELKQKEDEYLIRQSINSTLNSPIKSKSYGDHNGRMANNFSYIEPRSSSLPRGKDLQSYNVNQPIYTSPFVRGAPERRTDTYITNRSSKNDSEIIYRHPEKLAKIMYSRGSLPDSRYLNQTKRVSFNTQHTSDNVKSRDFKSDYQVVNKECSPFKVSELQSRVPPRPPVRTTSVGSTGKKFQLGYKKRIMHLAGGHSLCSESESGSEAGEIQRILLSNAQKGKLC